MSDPAKEWGLPDWRDEAAYGSTTSWGVDRWRWEFTRRREDVRSEFDANCQETYKKDLEHNQLPDVAPPRPEEPGFSAGSHLAIELGYHGLPNPRISDQPDYIIWNSKGRDAVMVCHADAIRNPKIQSIIFDMTKPLRPQIASAEKYLKEMQEEVAGRVAQKRYHTEKFLTYLRVLDARECGASWSEIATILPMTAGTEQTARDTWEQARALCFNF